MNEENPVKDTSIGLRIPTALVNRIDAVAKEEKRSRSQIVVICLEAHLATLEAKHGIRPSGGTSFAAERPKVNYPLKKKVRKNLTPTEEN